MKVSGKIILGFALAIAVSVTVGFVGYVSLNNISESDTALYEKYAKPMGILSSMATSFQRIRVNLRDAISENDTKAIADTLDRLATRISEIDADSDEYAKRIETKEGQDLFDKFLETREAFHPYMNDLIALAKANRDEEAWTLLKSDACYQAEQAEQDAILALAASKDKLAGAKADNNVSQSEGAEMTMIIVIVAGAILALLIALYIARMISGSMRKIIVAARQIADGDLSADVDIHSKDEIGELAAAFRGMTGNLNEVLGGINAASEQVSSGAKQLADSSMSLSQGASEQASSIEELTASLEEISSQTKLNAKNAGDANKLAGAARGDAEQGNGQMKEMLRAMEDINVSSSNISKIIKVIDDIAFQTNILALNAAVEAARAGQHGKGFAVVAEEVRNLAAKSASAAKETTEMIEGSIRKVEAGTKLATRTAEALEKIVSGVAEAASLVNQIDVASSEQSIGLNQINQAVMQVSQVVQANSAVSEQSAAASKELAGQAEMMRESVGRFKLKQSGHAQRAPKPVAAEAQPTAGELRAEGRRHNAKPTIALSDEEFGKY
jgi:methyl-accepting chemotaxis protein